MISKVIFKYCVCSNRALRRIRHYSTRNVMKLHERGLIQDIFPSTSAKDIIDLCNGKPQCVYAGFDPTARSLHIGHLLVLIHLMHWQRGGHQVIALVGGATGLVGDPSGRKKEREELGGGQVGANAQTIADSIRNLFENHQKYFSPDVQLPPVRLVNNLEWWTETSALDYLCRSARHLRVGQMMSRSSVEGRSSGLSLMELSYQAMQAYDWLHLLTEHDCKFQVGGKDQMGNIMTGHELISRVEDKEVYGLTVPLVTSEKGDKYGKSGGEAIWLDPGLTSPFELYQFLVRTPDSIVLELLKQFTFFPIGTIEQTLQGKLEERKAQRLLAENIVTLVHGESGLSQAMETTNALYGEGGGPEALGRLGADQLEQALRGATLVRLPAPHPGATLGELLISAKCFLDAVDMERVVKAGGVRVNRIKMRNPDEVLSPNLHILPNRTTIIRVGKRNYWVVRWSS